MSKKVFMALVLYVVAVVYLSVNIKVLWVFLISQIKIIQIIGGLYSLMLSTQ